MATARSPASCFTSSPSKECKESSIVQVMDSSERLVTESSLVHTTRAQVNSDEPLESVFLVDDDVPLVDQRGTSQTHQLNGSNVEQPDVPCQGSSSRTEAANEGDPLAAPLGFSGSRSYLSSAELRSQWNFRKILKKFATEEQCIEFAEEEGLLPTSKQCMYHKRPMSLQKKGQVGQFRCRKSNCRKASVSRATGTWFENVRLPLPLMFQIMYLYSHNFTYEQVQRETADEHKDTVLSDKTIANWYSYCRETVIAYVLEHTEELPKIGGVGKVVHFVQSKFGPRKYNKGCQVEGHWVIGMIEDGGDELRLEICRDNEQLSETLKTLIQKHVVIGTTIHTDIWREYDCLANNGYEQKIINHSDLERSVAIDRKHTQKIDNHLRILRRLYYKRDHKEDFADWLVEYKWRRTLKIKNLDPFLELIQCVKYVYSVK